MRPALYSGVRRGVARPSPIHCTKGWSPRTTLPHLVLPEILQQLPSEQAGVVQVVKVDPAWVHGCVGVEAPDARGLVGKWRQTRLSF